MKKLIFGGSICLLIIMILPFLLLSHTFRNSGSGASMGLQSCIIDTEKILEELDDSEKNNLDSLNSDSFKNEVISITLHQNRNPSLSETVSKANTMIQYAQDHEQVLTKSTFIQSMKYGNSFIDYLVQNSLNDTSIEINMLFEESIDWDKTVTSESAYYVLIQSEFTKSYCQFGTTGMPVSLPYTITGWFPFYNLNGTGGYHDGIDFGLDVGTPVFATNNGEVVLTSSGCANDGSLVNKCGAYGDDGLPGISGLGNFVIIKVAEEDTFLAYAHLSSPLVRVGDQVVIGQQIGLSGNSGKSTGPHLHFVVTRSNNLYDVTNSLKVINPCDYILNLCNE